ncbi:hypothetical protein LZ31DRAFT_313850 [Colletotrichum somersetense]|nr:hypothetical protein LZ31DRAFT_313850 [Colletotrichum somersetense]
MGFSRCHHVFLLPFSLILDALHVNTHRRSNKETPPNPKARMSNCNPVPPQGGHDCGCAEEVLISTPTGNDPVHQRRVRGGRVFLPLHPQGTRPSVPACKHLSLSLSLSPREPVVVLVLSYPEGEPGAVTSCADLAKETAVFPLPLALSLAHDVPDAPFSIPPPRVPPSSWILCKPKGSGPREVYFW